MSVTASVALLAAQAVSPTVEHPLPLGAAKPVLEYTGCLLELLGKKLEAGLPVLRDEREKVVVAHLANCASARAKLQQEALSAVSSVSDKAEVNRAFVAAESQVRFIIIDHEKFVAASDAFCRERGEEPGC